MPKIPIHTSEGQIAAPTTRVSVPGGQGQGLRALGEDVFGLGLLFPSFERAQAHRQQATAHLQNLEARIGSDQIAVRSINQLNATTQAYEDELQKQAATEQPTWMIALQDPEQGEQVVTPIEAFNRSFGLTYKQALKDAERYGPEAQAAVSAKLEQAYGERASKFQDTFLKLRIGKVQGDVDTLLADYTTKAGDPGNLHRTDDIAQGLDLITRAQAQGALKPEDAAKRKLEFQSTVSDRYFSTLAQTAPEQFLDLDAAPPPGMNPEKLKEYRELAFGTLAKQQSAKEHQRLEFEQGVTRTRDERESELVSLAYKTDISLELERDRVLLGRERYDRLRSLNRTLLDARTKDVTADQAKLSATNRFPLMVDARAAKLNPDILNRTNETVVAQKVKAGELTAQDGEQIINVLAEARNELNTKGRTVRKELTGQGEKVLNEAFAVPAYETKYSTFVKDVAAQARLRYYTLLEQQPDANPLTLATQVDQEFRPLVLAKKEATFEELLSQVQTQRSTLPPSVFQPGSFKLDRKHTDQLIRSGAISRAWVQSYENNVAAMESLSQMEKERGEQAATTTTPRKKPGLLGR